MGRMGFLISLVLLAGACDFSFGPRTASDFARQFGGDQSTYSQLLSSDDCAALLNDATRGQNNYEDTGDRQWTGYQRAAEQRYNELGCEAVD